jgi:hypothetical protein
MASRGRAPGPPRPCSGMQTYGRYDEVAVSNAAERASNAP